jgi:hypothetical protein
MNPPMKASDEETEDRDQQSTRPPQGWPGIGAPPREQSEKQSGVTEAQRELEKKMKSKVAK